jgi:hypothetical protein
MSQKRPAQIKPHHLVRMAVVYRPRRGQKAVAQRWGWPTEAIEVITDDDSPGGPAESRRRSLERLVGLVAQGAVGLILLSEMSDLTPSSRDFDVVRELCRITRTLIAVDGIIVDLDADEQLLERIRARIAQFESDMLVRSLRNSAPASTTNGHGQSSPEQ